jgi:hypothetical protein
MRHKFHNTAHPVYKKNFLQNEEKIKKKSVYMFIPFFLLWGD